MFTVPTPAWLDTFANTVHATMRRCGASRNCCVEACLVGVGVARAFGVLAEPVPVAVQVIAGTQATILPGPGSRSQDGYAGHLILHFPTAGTLVDLTADQFHAPARGLLVPEPIVVEVGRDALAEGISMDLPGGTSLGYRELVGDLSWQATDAWRLPSAFTTSLAVKALRAAIDNAMDDK